MAANVQPVSPRNIGTLARRQCANVVARYGKFYQRLQKRELSNSLQERLLLIPLIIISMLFSYLNPYLIVAPMLLQSCANVAPKSHFGATLAVTLATLAEGDNYALI